MPSKAVGFWRGFVAPFGALRFLLGTPRAWPLMLVPVVIFVLLEASFIGLSLHFVMPSVKHFSGDALWWREAAPFAAWLAVALSAMLGWVLSGLLAPALSGPALERIVAIAEQQLAVPSRAPLGFFVELGCGLRATALSLALTLPLLLALTLLEMVAPPLSVVTTPLKLLLAALGVAWGLFDYPLTLRGIGARQRFAFMRRHFAVVLGFGAAFSLLFWLPCFGILMLPVGVAAATRLYWQIERAQ